MTETGSEMVVTPGLEGLVDINNVELLPVRYSNGWDPHARRIAMDHMRYAASLGLAHLMPLPPNKKTCVIVGAAPDVGRHMARIRALQDAGAYVFALNGATNALQDAGIVPNGMVFFEIDAEADIGKWRLHGATDYYVCTFCHPDTFRACIASGGRVITWNGNSNCDEHNALMTQLFSDQPCVCGGISTVTRVFPIAIALGMRDFEVFGVDCSFVDDAQTHVFGTPGYIGTHIDIHAGNPPDQRTFRTTKLYARQAQELKDICTSWHWMFTMRVHGEGLFPFIHREMYPQFYEAKEAA